MDLNTDNIVILSALFALSVIWVLSNRELKIYLLKWMAASLVIPVLVAVSKSTLGPLIAFWPGSIVLMTLGSRNNAVSVIVYTWSYGIALNIILYFIIGIIIHYIIKMLKS